MSDAITSSPKKPVDTAITASSPAIPSDRSIVKDVGFLRLFFYNAIWVLALFFLFALLLIG